MELVRDVERKVFGRQAISSFACARPLIACAQCGDRIYIPVWSECLEEERVRHLWQCETCDYAFETTVRFAATVEA